MSVLSGKKILLGISGGIAAYKSPLIVRLLKSLGAEVKIVMTPSAKDFVTPLTLSTLSNHPVYSTFTEELYDNPVWNDHVALGKWADLLLIAPATSNTLSAMVHAKCNNLLIATYLSCTCPVYIAPAMDLDMYAHPANQQNLKELNRIGNKVLSVGEGFLASGLHGKGRMLEPEEIIRHISEDLESGLPLYGKKVLITAGPTYEPIDPVRFIGNHSSGKMGFALAEEARQLGAHVTLISGPTVLVASPDIDRHNVLTAQEMYAIALEYFAETDIAIAAAAVADFKPLNVGDQKIKKESGFQSIELEKTLDILAEMGKRKQKQFLLGFALETEDEISNAIKKIKSKNLDAIVLNSLNEHGAGFSVDSNKVTYIDQNETIIPFELKSKILVAKDIFSQILTQNA
ncbi:MAG: bifunctional phosphopantothenoylcysteine decarboxylase/phosphopantothenate--cysteine ligase CoaBC [Bacteroidetes bacterium]|jgi:phosphopantothenoylcysteine decarboxylase/phosphopantothenate--cysteine ligase|nr:bifunctional phosphopantothenoylcysteine decarboxylase/phosphopantothenate--cysteine ligase CoaBC [Flavobacteriaceae bacterium]MBT6127986.1 bifunctional phosphopantothenoylcysteine decarboxylase/phosphopantothenate--cysteine ligase CoaBC [Flavobacteriaceae bacterium]NCF31142.1 bifunctional phosphopantothenoylcysteine decarboxylase/phosphopantothenate--cysteine ligase CoaBC [Bacteroidota bacterium]